MGTYIHYFETEAELNRYRRGYTETIETIAINDGWGVFAFDGFNKNTNRYVWTYIGNPPTSFETEEEHPNLDNALTTWEFYNNQWETWEYGPGECSYTTVQKNKKVNSQYVEPWVSFTVGKGIDYNYKYQYVDLGLPSGILWATTNVGALAPEMYGNYYAWGETFTKSAYTWDNYTLGGYPADYPKKYNSTDKLYTLELVDDVAHSVMGGNWRMPTIDEFYELINGTNYEWTSLNGVNGARLTSKSDSSKSIFFPAAGGYRASIDEEFVGEGEVLWLWTSTKISYPWLAGSTSGGEDGIDTEIAIGRQDGLTIRGVIG